MTGPRIFVAVLILLVVLFACGLSLNFTHGRNEKVDLQGSLAKGLGGMLIKPLNVKDVRVAPGQLPSCLQAREFVIQSGRTCIYTVQKASDLSSRKPQLRLKLGSSAGVTIEQKIANEEMLKQSEILASGKRTENLSVFKDGGTLSINCITGGVTGCRLELE